MIVKTPFYTFFSPYISECRHPYDGVNQACPWVPTGVLCREPPEPRTLTSKSRTLSNSWGRLALMCYKNIELDVWGINKRQISLNVAYNLSYLIVVIVWKLIGLGKQNFS